MIKTICLKICLLSALLSIMAGIVVALAPSATENDKQQAEVKAYFEKTPEELHQDLLKQNMQDQEWLNDQMKQSKKQKMIVGSEGKPANGNTEQPPLPEPTMSPPTDRAPTPPPGGNPPPQKQPED